MNSRTGQPAGETGDRVEVVAATSQQWYELASRFADWGYRHSYDFNLECGRYQGTKVEHVQVLRNGELIGLASVRIKRLSLLGLGIAYVGGGPLTRSSDSIDAGELLQVLLALRQEFVQRRRLVLRISPPLAPQQDVALAHAAYLEAGFSPSASSRTYRTMLLDLSPSISEITASFSQRWKRQLGKGLKSGFEIESGTDIRLFDAFCDLFERFVDWKGFEVEHGPRFHRNVQNALPEEAKYMVLLARHEGNLAGGLVLARTGDTAVYVLGATNPEMRDLRPGHFLHFRAVEMLKEMGLRFYDLGGIDPENNPGVYEFKAGMTQVDICAPKPMECAPGRVRRLAVDAIELLYRKTRNRLRAFRASRRDPGKPSGKQTAA